MGNKKHDWKVIYRNEDGSLNSEWGFMGTTTRKFQVELGKLVKSGELPMKFYKTGRITIEKDGVASTFGA